ncbi:GDSL-type esterase/lipase family protein [Paenibacillus koleovorans]|uniref:GDSL-type esterase/lipase family protein n=1 Tax=Paenibacillus koleovorans TaxID=121608 RepID=UPI000FDAF14F|nr:GDSL-type esterase/lipase family protein [Paenibacillus koleovorans]
MKSSRLLWRTVGLAAVLTTVMMLVGLVYAMNDILNPQPVEYMAEPEQPKPESPLDKNSINIVALGDSLTKGTGDASGKGYVLNVKEQLEKKAGKEVHLIGNYGISGYKTDQLLKDLQEQKSIAYGIDQADLILLTMGGNDLFDISKNVQTSSTDQLDPEKVRLAMPEPLKRMEQILVRLAELNPQATIAYVGVYNPFYDLPEMRPASVHVAEWNEAVFRLTLRYPNLVYVPSFDLFQLNFSKYIYTDHFHPNEQGYVRIAERVVQALQ